MDELDLPLDSPLRFAQASTDELLARAVALAGDEAVEEFEYWPRIRQLYGRPSRELFEVVSAWLESANPAERRVGADILSQLGTTRDGSPFAEESLDRLVPLLIAEREANVLASTASAIAHLIAETNRGTIGHEGVSRLLDLIPHPDVGVRQSVAQALSAQSSSATTDTESARCVAGLVRLSHDEDRDVRDWVSFYLGFVAQHEGPVRADVLAALWRLAAEDDQEIRVQALNGLAQAGDRSVLPELIREIDLQAAADEASFWWDTFEAIEALPDRSLLPHLTELRKTMAADEELPEYWMRMVDDAIAACAALPE